MSRPPTPTRRCRHACGLLLATAAWPAGLRAPVAAQTLQPLPVGTGVRTVQGGSALGSVANRNFICNAAFAVTAEGAVLVLPQQHVLVAGDIVLRGRLPFAGQAGSASWSEALDRLLALRVQTMVPGHGPVSTSAESDLMLRRDYRVQLRQTMAEAARNLEPFEEAYAKADWSRFEHLPLFRAAKRINAYDTYLLMEQAGK